MKIEKVLETHLQNSLTTKNHSEVMEIPHFNEFITEADGSLSGAPDKLVARIEKLAPVMVPDY